MAALLEHPRQNVSVMIQESLSFLSIMSSMRGNHASSQRGGLAGHWAPMPRWAEAAPCTGRPGNSGFLFNSVQGEMLLTFCPQVIFFSPASLYLVTDHLCSLPLWFLASTCLCNFFSPPFKLVF